MKEDYDPSFENNNNEERFVKLEDMFSDSAYYYFDVSEWQGIIEYYLSILKLDKATKALNFAKNQHPSAVEISIKEAELLSEKNNPFQAILMLQKLEETFPFDVEIPTQMGEIHSRFGDSLKALNCYKIALDKCSKEEEFHLFLQISAECQNLEKPNQSIFWLKKLIKNHPENIEGLYEIAMVYEGEGLLIEGEAFFNSFIENNPYNHHAWFNLGNLYSFESKLEDALHAYEYSVVSFSEFSSGWFNKGSILARLGRFEDAIECFEATLELEGSAAATYCNIGECHEETEDFGKAMEYYQKALKHDEHYSDAIDGAASCLYLQDKLEDALLYCETGLKQNPQRPGLLHTYAEVCQALGFFKEAKKSYKKVIKVDSDNWEVFLDYSGMLWENGQLEEAIEVIQSGISLQGKIPELNYRTGSYLYMAGDKTNAFNHWNNAFLESPSKINQIFDFCAAFENDLEIKEFFEQF
jgi:tetratricopeptide (TPR) repeat protein|tara:strand:+ start:10654 stop:12060 length:1407 start_codon:yes stop_codon:yes gene_type:complete